MNFITFVLSKFITKLLAANYLIIYKGTKFDTEQKTFRFLLEIMTLWSSANNTVSGTEFILKGRSFVYIINNRGLKIDP
jgi:hypothetical protein